MKKYLLSFVFVMLMVTVIPNVTIAQTSQSGILSALSDIMLSIQSLIKNLPSKSFTAAAGLSGNDISITPVSATLVAQYNPARPNTPYVVSTNKVIVKPNKNLKVYCSVPTIVMVGSDIANYYNTQQFSCTVKGATGDQNTGFNLIAGTPYEYLVSKKIDSNEMLQGSYISSLQNISYLIGDNGYYVATVSNNASPALAVVGETGPYIKSITQTGDAVSIIGERFDSSMSVSVNGKKFTVSALPTLVLFNQKTNGVPNGSQQVSVTGTKGSSNNKYFDFEGSQAVLNVTVDGNPSTWTQNTTKNVTWTTQGSISNVDVLVCQMYTPTTKCFFAYQNIPNTGVANNVRLGFNIIPSTATTNSYAYVKVRKAGDESVAGVNKGVIRVLPSGTLASASFVLTSKSISKSSTASQSNTATSTGEAIFNLNITARDGDIMFGTTASGTPMVGTSTAYVKVYKNGAALAVGNADFYIASSTAYDVPSPYNQVGNSFVIPSGVSVNIPVIFRFEGRKTNGSLVGGGSYAVQLEGLSYVANGKKVFYSTASSPDWRTTGITLP